MGKIQLIKTFVLSKLTYVSSLTFVPLWVVEEINTLIFDFLWRGKDKIKRDILCLDYNSGGLKMIDFQLFIKVQRIMWIKRLILGEPNMRWKQYFSYLTRKVGGLLIFYSNITINLMKIPLPDFYIDMMEVWFNKKNFLLKEEESRRNELIFNNRFIRLDGQTHFDEKLFLKNVYKLHHIVDREGKLKSSQNLQRMGLDRLEMNKVIHIFECIPYA